MQSATAVVRDVCSATSSGCLALPHRRFRSKESARRSVPVLVSGFSGGVCGVLQTSKLYAALPRSMTSCSSFPLNGTQSTLAMVSPTLKWPCTSAAPPLTMLTTVFVSSSSRPRPYEPRLSMMKRSWREGGGCTAPAIVISPTAGCCCCCCAALILAFERSNEAARLTVLAEGDARGEAANATAPRPGAGEVRDGPGELRFGFRDHEKERFNPFCCCVLSFCASFLASRLRHADCSMVAAR
mmetsp:Transcript_45534/g.99173  ORF Transcript_45534/g.99173 Transcript_45534/m.99173 type:complete len:241 (+) Transcript_45534:419-1141(+)